MKRREDVKETLWREREEREREKERESVMKDESLKC